MAFLAQAIVAFTGLSCEFPIQVTSSNENRDETWFWMAPGTGPLQHEAGVRSRLEDKRFSMRVLWPARAKSKTNRVNAAKRTHDSFPEISFIGKREKSEGKPPQLPNVKTGREKSRIKT